MLAARGKQIGAGEIAAAEAEAEAALVHRHPREGRDPGWLPLCAIFTVRFVTDSQSAWIPAFAGMTVSGA